MHSDRPFILIYILSTVSQLEASYLKKKNKKQKLTLHHMFAVFRRNFIV